MQADAEQIHSKPRKTRRYVANYGEVHDAAVTDDPAPARMKNDGVPKNDKESAIFFWVPPPKTAPGLIGPDATKNGAGETEESGKTNDAINHFRKCFAELDLTATFRDLPFHHLGTTRSMGVKAEGHSSSFAKFFAQKWGEYDVD